MEKEPPPIEVPALSLSELKEKTGNFGSKALVGEGSYGRVYYAMFSGEKQVGVKKLDSSSDPEPEFEFLTQVFYAQC
jgi:pto-interacting protein 1